MRCVRLFLNRFLVLLGGRGGFVFARSCAPNNRSAMHFWRRSNLWGGSLATALFCTRFGSATGLLPSVPFWVEILTFFTNPFDLIGAHVRGRESAKQQHDYNANMAVARRCLQAHSTNRFFAFYSETAGLSMVIFQVAFTVAPRSPPLPHTPPPGACRPTSPWVPCPRSVGP